MIAKLENEKTLVITPESTAEMIVLKTLAGGTVSVREPEPFQTNVVALVVKADAGKAA